MPSYDFKNLSAYDFEILCRDLLEAELNIYLESYKSGRDKGIDLRGYESVNATIIIQCKHYANSKFSNLFSIMRDNEAEKVEKLNPSSYFLVTSLSLSVDNKDKLFQLLPSYFESTAHIIGLEDLNKLLAKHPDVQKQHYKLWLSSTTVLERILHSDIVNRSSAKLHDIQDKLKLYVQNESYFKAKAILEDYRYLIISGIAGIGKTTLANILAYTYISDNYEFIEITENISEGWKLLKPSKKQIFYYDDFLGQTSISDKLSKNEDQGIVSFIREVNKSKHKRFILTTREYLLQQAKQNYERLADESISIAKCIVDLEDYTTLIRARILYNHLYFSSIPNAYKMAVLENGAYKKIIKHRNFNPRIIEAMVSSLQSKNVAVTNYAQAFVSNLDNPRRIWDFAYHRQISQSSRDLLVKLLITGERYTVQSLQQLFVKTTTHNEHDYIDSLKELDGCFVRIDKSYWNDNELTVMFHNPSIRDYLQDYVASTPSAIEDLIVTATHFEQLYRLWGYPFSSNYSQLRVGIVKKSKTYIGAIQGLLFTSERTRPSVSYADRARLLLDLFDKTHDASIKPLVNQLIDSLKNVRLTDTSTWVRFLKEAKKSRIFHADEIEELVHIVKTRLAAKFEGDLIDTDEMTTVIDFLEANEEFFSEEDINVFRDHCLESYDNFEIHKDEIDNFDTIEELNEYMEQVIRIFDYLATTYNDIEDAITNRIEEIEEDLNSQEEDESSEIHSYAPIKSDTDSEELEIDLMFSPEALISLDE